MNLSGPLPSLDTLEACIWLEYLLLGDVRQLLDEPSSASRRVWLAALVGAIIDNLARLSQLRNDGGIVSDVLDEMPRWHFETAVFAGETLPERLWLEELHARLQRGLPSKSDSHAVRDDQGVWMKSLVAHPRAVRRLRIVEMALIGDVAD